jgi:hypothetical protein
MASITFARGTPITSDWCNSVDALVYDVLNGLSSVPTSGKILRSNGTNVVPSTFTLPDTYTTGDLVQATAANTLSALSAVATGNALISGGVGAASTWGKIGLTTHVSGTLAVGNGGTGLTTFTAKGAIPAASAATTLVAQAVGTDGQALHADSSQTAGLVYIDNPSRPNLLINPNWQIDQINEGALYTVTGGGATIQGPDGWSGVAVAAPGVFKLRTLADPDNAALKCLEITCTTIDATIGAGDLYLIQTAVEGYDSSCLMIGTASAQTATVQFDFKTNVTGVYGVAVRNSAVNRSYVGIITVADTASHTYSLSIPMDTAGTWLYTNGVGLYLSICLAGGSTYQTTSGSWQAGQFLTTSAQCNFMSNVANVAYLKRIQLIPGGLVQAYKPADIQKELAKAQRQYFKTFGQGTAVAQAAGTLNTWIFSQCVGAATANQASGSFRLPTPMRAAPTVTWYNPSASNAQARNVSVAADTSAFVTQQTDTMSIDATYTTAAGSAVGNQSAIHMSANARLS